ncbi:GNAT domain-containing protein [Powellomyces hirtus]|nr:GNAT domain-containing protein [Powellomyces hirtus]
MPSPPPTPPPYLLSSRLIYIPSPTACKLPSYRKFYSAVASDVRVTFMGWGDANPVGFKTDADLDAHFDGRIAESWDVVGFGPIAVGLKPQVIDAVTTADLDSIQWVGSAGIRDALATSIPRERDGHNLPPLDSAHLPPLEMVELKYGLHPDAWGQGYATEIARTLIDWGVQTFGIKRYIACTGPDNDGSISVLKKIGFVANEDEYWGPGFANWQYVINAAGK